MIQSPGDDLVRIFGIWGVDEVGNCPSYAGIPPDLMGSRIHDEWDDDTHGDQGFDLGGNGFGVG